MLEQIKLLLGISDNSEDILINLLIEICEEEAFAYCNLPEYDERLDKIVLQMVIQSYNRLGTEGVASHSFSGVSESYIEGYSLNIKRALNRHRRLVVI